jgi:hypothetical protein
MIFLLRKNQGLQFANTLITGLKTEKLEATRGATMFIIC